MRTLNVRLAAILLTIVVVLSVGVHLLHAVQIRRNADVLLEDAKNLQKQAKEAEARGDFAAARKLKFDAARQLGWYASMMPDKLNVREEHALLLADLAYDNTRVMSNRLFGEVMGRLETLVREDPKRSKARKKLVDMEMRAGRLIDAKVHLQEYLLKENPEDAEMLQLLGQCQIGLGEYKAAKASLEKAIQINPRLYRAYPYLAVLLRVRLSEPAAGDALMKKLVDDNPDSYMAHLLRGHYLSQLGNPNESYDEMMKALKLAPENMEVLEMAAKTALATGKREESLGYAAKGVKLYPANPEYYHVMAVAEVQMGHFDKAMAALRQGLKDAGRNVRLRLLLAELLIDTKQIKDAESLIAELKDPNFESETEQLPRPEIDHIAAYLKARIEYTEGKWLSACETLERVRGPLSVRWQFLLPRIDLPIADCYKRLGNSEQQEKALRRLLAADPGNPNAKGQLMALLGARGKTSAAIQEFEEMQAEGQAGTAAPLVKVQLLLQKTMQQPRAARDWAPVEAALNEASVAMPDEVLVELVRVQMLVSQERFEEAEKSLQAALKKNPKKENIYLLMLARLASQRKQWDKAEGVLRRLEEASGDSPSLRLTRGELLVAKEGKGAKAALRKMLDNVEKFNENQQLQLWAGLYDLASRIGDTEQADMLLKRRMEKLPNDSKLRYAAWEQAYRTNDRKAMQEALGAIEKVAGRRWYWLYAQAVMLRLNARDSKNTNELYEQALTNLSKAKEARSDWAKIPLEEGIIYDLMGDRDQALKAFVQAYELGERSDLVILRMISYLVQSQQFEDANQKLEQLEQELGTLPLLLRRMSVEIALQQGNAERAAMLLAKVPLDEVKEYPDQFWYGRMCFEISKRLQGQLAEARKLGDDAEKHLRRATELDPKRPEAWVVLTQFYVEQGKTKEAEAVVQEASDKLDSKIASLTLARCNEMLRKVDAAEKLYLNALTASPGDVVLMRSVIEFYIRQKKLTEAEKLLKQVLDEKSKSSPANLAWARRQLAIVYIMQGGRKKQEQALELVEKNIAAGTIAVEDRRVKSQILAGDPSRAKKEEAIAMLNALVDEQLATADDRFLLARLYNSVGNWTKANEQLRFLAVTYETEPRFLTALIEGLLKHGAAADASFYLDRLEKLQPNWYPAVHLRVWQLTDQNEPERAKDLLMQFLDSQAAVPENHSMRMRLVADEFEQLGTRLRKTGQTELAEQHTSRAESLYEALVKEGPERDLLLVAFLARQGRIDNAIDLLAKTVKERAPQEVAIVASTIVSQPNVSPAQLDRLYKLLEGLPRGEAKAVPLAVAMGDIEVQRKNFPEAEKKYLEVVKADADNFVALNNLAVLWALQGKNVPEALKLVNKAIEIAGPMAQVLDSRATVYTALQQYDKALEDLEAALHDQETPERFFHQAWAQLLLGNDRMAQVAMKKALDKGLKKERLHPLEVPAYEKLMKLMSQ